MKYRADVDGLRAVAVLSVLAFHAQIRGFNGGFVGVDVFFVISGFLITGIIEGELQRGSFSIAEFYKRRVHRIFPALFAMMAVTTAVAMAVLLPSELIRFGRSLIGTSLFSSNILFYAESGYFDADAAIKPLLHTWSLAIEEQYYVIWPVLLVLAHRFGWRARGFAVVLTVASLAASVLMVKSDASAAFYLLPSRAWELLLGGLLAVDAVPRLRVRALREVGGILGLGLILFAVKFYSPQTPFPGWAALAPCLGAALVLQAGRDGSSLVGRVLGLAPMRWLGLISYSLYLWHWPVIVFARIGLYLAITPVVQIGIVALSLALATLSWAFVERPFQQARSRIPRRVSLSVAVAAMAVVCLAGWGLIAARGLPSRYTPHEQAIAAFEDYKGDAKYRGGRCFLAQPHDQFDAALCLKRTPGHPAVLLLGDSHAAHLWPGLAGRSGATDLLQANSAGCKPVLGPQQGTLPRCQALMHRMFDQVVAPGNLDAVVVAARWKPTDLPALPSTLSFLRTHARRVVLVGPIPQYPTALPRLLVHGEQIGRPDWAAGQEIQDLAGLDKSMRRIAAAAGVEYVSLRDVLCRPGCRTTANPDVPLQFDYGHLTVEGSQVVADALAPAAFGQTPAPTPH